MKNNLKIIANEIARDLLNNYYNYYYTVYFGFIEEAVENTIKDFGYEVKPLEEIHTHIKENYI